MNNKIRVCHFTNSHRQDDARIFQKECKSLSNNGYEVFLVAYGESREEEGIHVIGCGSKSHSRLSKWLVNPRAVYQKALEVNADIYHFHDPELLPYGLKLVKKGYKVIWDSHEDFFKLYKTKKDMPILFVKIFVALFNWWYKRALSKFSAVVYVTPSMKDSLESDCKKLYMITNFPIVNEKEYTKPDYTSKRIGFAGAIRDEWSHKEILKALANNNGVSYLLCGFGFDSYIQELKEMPEWDMVDYKGLLPFNAVKDALQTCSVGMALLKPNEMVGKEGTLGNNKVYEAMVQGLPVICSDNDIWKAMVQQYNCGICVDPFDIDSISSAIATLTNNTTLCEEMGTSARNAVLKEYNWKTQERILLEMYRNL